MQLTRTHIQLAMLPTGLGFVKVSHLPGFPVFKITFRLVWIWDCKIHLFQNISWLLLAREWASHDMAWSLQSVLSHGVWFLWVQAREAKKLGWNKWGMVVSCIWKGNGRLFQHKKIQRGINVFAFLYGRHSVQRDLFEMPGFHQSYSYIPEGE